MKLLIPLLLISILTNGQQSKYKFKVKEHIAPASCVLVAGIAEGFQDLLAFHNNSNNYFYGMDSWKNKYVDRDPAKGLSFQGKWLVFTTDGFHAAKLTKNIFLSGAIALKIGQEKKRWYYYILEGLGYWAINRVGFTIIWETVKIK